MTNIEKFQQLLASDPQLAERATTLASKDPSQTAAALAALSSEIGVPVEIHEFEAFAFAASAGAGNNAAEAAGLSGSAMDPQLDDAALEAVAGGAWRPSAGNILVSILGGGLLCGIFATHSFLEKGDADKCQVDNPQRGI